MIFVPRGPVSATPLLFNLPNLTPDVKFGRLEGVFS